MQKVCHITLFNRLPVHEAPAQSNCCLYAWSASPRAIREVPPDDSAKRTVKKTVEEINDLFDNQIVVKERCGGRGSAVYYVAVEVRQFTTDGQRFDAQYWH